MRITRDQIPEMKDEDRGDIGDMFGLRPQRSAHIRRNQAATAELLRSLGIRPPAEDQHENEQ